MSVTTTAQPAGQPSRRPAVAGSARPAAPAGVLGRGVAEASVEQLLTAAGELLQVAYQRVQADHGGLSQEVLLDQVVTAQQVQNSAWAVQTHRLVQAAAIEYRNEPNPTQNALPERVARVVRHTPGDFIDEWFPLEVATRLSWSHRHTDVRVGDAFTTLQACPRLLDRVGAGSLDPGKACAVAQISTGAPAHIAEAVEDTILAGNPETMTVTKVRAKARRVRVRLDPISAEHAATTRRRSAVGVWVSPHHEPGLSQLTAVLPTLDAAKLMTGVEELARELHQVTTTDKTLSECRVDALTDLTLSGVGVDTQLTFHVPVTPPTPPAPPAPVTGEPWWLADPVFVPADWAADLDEPVDGFDHASPDYDWHAEGLTPTGGPDVLDEELRALFAQDLTDLNTATRQRLHDPVDPWGGTPPEPISDPSPNGSPDTAHRRHQETKPADNNAADAETTSAAIANAGIAGAAVAHAAIDDVETAGGIGDVLLPRIGVIPAAVIEDMTTLLGIKLSRALTDATTGTVIETSDRSYRPGARLARFVQTRDQHCRFPGCTQPAKLSDLDHVTRYPDGPTAAGNLQCLCRHHHRAKHEGGWTVTMTPQGDCTWTSPTGHTYQTTPGD